MKKLVCCMLFSAVALLGDVTGKWSGPAKGSTSDGDSEVMTITLDLKQSGKQITGTAKSDQGPDLFSITQGAIDGEDVNLQVQANDSTYSVTLKVKGDQMTGEASTTQGDRKLTIKLDLKRQT